MLMIANVVTVPLSGSSMKLSSSSPVAGSASLGGKYTLPSLPVRAPSSLPSSSARRNAVSGSEAVCWISMLLGVTWTVTGSRSSVASDTGSASSPSPKEGKMVSPPAGADRVGRSGVHRVQQWDVGAVEFDQRPRERPVQRLSLKGFGLPGPRQHGP